MPTQKQIADHLDLSQKAVSELMADLGMSAKTHSLDQVRVGYLRKLRGAASGHKSGEGMDLIKERVLNERVDRQIKELTLAEKRGLLVNVEQLEPELAQLFVAFRTEMMARDERLKADLDALYGINVDLAMLNDHTHDALHQLARYDPERAGTAAPSAVAGAAAAEDDHDGLGESASPAEPEGIGQAGAVQP